MKTMKAYTNYSEKVTYAQKLSFRRMQDLLGRDRRTIAKKHDEILRSLKRELQNKLDVLWYNIIMKMEWKEIAHEQVLITEKDSHNAYSVERKYVNSKRYHDKFEELPVGKEVQEALYTQAGRLLEFVDGQEEERMLAVNGRTGAFIVDNFSRPGSIKGTSFTEEEYAKIQECDDSVIVMHSHSLNGRPSAKDISTYYYEHNIKISIIVCHNGTIYAIYKVSDCFEDIYNDFLERELAFTTSMKEAKRLALTKLYQLNDKLSDRHKIFDVRRLGNDE